MSKKISKKALVVIVAVIAIIAVGVVRYSDLKVPKLHSFRH